MLCKYKVKTLVEIEVEVAASNSLCARAVAKEVIERKMPNIDDEYEFIHINNVDISTVQFIKHISEEE